jgi:hypothetical protein
MIKFNKNKIELINTSYDQAVYVDGNLKIEGNLQVSKITGNNPPITISGTKLKTKTISAYTSDSINLPAGELAILKFENFTTEDTIQQYSFPTFYVPFIVTNSGNDLDSNSRHYADSGSNLHLGLNAAELGWNRTDPFHLMKKYNTGYLEYYGSSGSSTSYSLHCQHDFLSKNKIIGTNNNWGTSDSRIYNNTIIVEDILNFQEIDGSQSGSNIAEGSYDNYKAGNNYPSIVTKLNSALFGDSYNTGEPSKYTNYNYISFPLSKYKNCLIVIFYDFSYDSSKKAPRIDFDMVQSIGKCNTFDLVYGDRGRITCLRSCGNLYAAYDDGVNYYIAHSKSVTINVLPIKVDTDSLK